MNDELDAWFAREILVHERALTCFLHRNWRDHDEVPDLRQEAYVRVYEAAMRRRPDSPRSFLFTAARNLMADRIRRQRIVSIAVMGDLEELHVLKDELEPARWLDSRDALVRLAHAMDRLPDRCREVVWLRRVKDVPQREIAHRLGISEKTVEKHIAKGCRLMANYFYGGADAGTAPRDKRDIREQSRKGTCQTIADE